jgi:cytochrome P450
MTEHTLTRYEHAEQALRNEHLMQALYDAGKEVLMESALVTLHGKEHQDRKRLETKIFRRDFMQYFEKELLPDMLAETIAPYLESRELDVVEFGYRVMIHLAIAFAGIDRQAKTIEETETLLKLIRVFGQAATLGQIKGDPEPVKQEIRDHLKLFETDFFQPSFDKREALVRQWRDGSLSDDALPRDVLTLLIQNDDNLNLDRDIIMRETAFYYLAGAHTSVHSLTHLVHHLLTWCDDHPGDRARLESDIGLVQRFAHESFRLHPSSPVAKRRALQAMTLPDGAEAAADDIVIVDLRSANRSPELFGADADAFNPFREAPASMQLHGISFGSGAHVCIGRNLAAGVLQSSASQAPQYGTITLIAHRLLTAGMTHHPTESPRLNAQINRETWEYYPAVLKPGDDSA